MALLLALALAVTPPKPSLLPSDYQEQLEEYDRTTRIQVFVSIAVSLLMGIGIGVGSACFAVWNAPKFGAPLGVCGR